jgi:hypothetical protein
VVYAVSGNNESAWDSLQNKKNTQEHGSFSGLNVKPADVGGNTTCENKTIGFCKQLKEYSVNLVADIAVFLANTLERACSGISNFLYYDEHKLPLNIIPRKAEYKLKQILEFKEKIGSGRASNVFLGMFQSEDVVIKKISKKKVTYLDAKIEVANLFWVQKNPSFVEVVSAYQDKNDYYIIMKAGGKNLAAIFFDELKKDQPTENVNKIGYTVVETAECLKALFRTGVFFRDFRLPNILYTDSNMKICDMGFESGQGAFVHTSPKRRLIGRNITFYKSHIEGVFRALLEEGSKYDTSVLLKEYTEEKRQSILEKYLKPELDKNNFITKEIQQKIKQILFNNIKTTEDFAKSFLYQVYYKLDYDELLDKRSYDDVVSIMISVIDGWQNLIKDELGYAKLTNDLGNTDIT